MCNSRSTNPRSRSYSRRQRGGPGDTLVMSGEGLSREEMCAGDWGKLEKADEEP